MKITINQLRRIIKEEVTNAVAGAVEPDALTVAQELADNIGGMDAGGDAKEASFDVRYNAGDKKDANDVIANLSNMLRAKRADNWGDKTSFHEFRYKVGKTEVSVEFSTFDEAEYLNPGTITVKVRIYKV